MRIAMVTHGFPPKETAGTEWHSYLLARELSKRHSVYVFSRGIGESYEEYAEEFDGIPVKRMNTRSGHKAFLDTYVDDRVALSFSEFLENSEPDVIHVQHCIGLGVSMLEVPLEKRIPTVVFLHDFYLMCHRVHLLKPDEQPCPGPKSQSYCVDCIRSYDPSLTEVEARNEGLRRYRYIQGLLSRIDQIVVPSKFVKRAFQTNYPKIRNIIMSPLGLDLRFAKDYQKKQSKKIRLGYFGPILPQKGVHILVEAFERVRAKNLELRIHGGGEASYLKEVKENASKGNILFFGPYAHGELAKVLSEIDIFVLPSICHESFSFTIREALAVGIPVIVSNIGAQSDAITEGLNGLHFKCGDPDDLAEKLELMAKEPALLGRLAKNAKKTTIRTIDAQAREMENLYLKSVRPGKGRLLKEKQTFPSGRPLINLLSYIRSLEKGQRDIIAEERKKARSEMVRQFTEPMGRLLAVYAMRQDLQSSFPEVRNGKYIRLLEWAREDPSTSVGPLADFAKWYKENDWLRLPSLEAERTRLSRELGDAKGELAQLESSIQSLEAEKTRLSRELGDAKGELAQLESSIQSLEAEKTRLSEDLATVREDITQVRYELSSAVGELGAIKQSLGYRFTRFYARRIDKLFPEGTRRGELRNRVRELLLEVTEPPK